MTPPPPSSPLDDEIGPTGKAYLASLQADASTWNQTPIDLDADVADLMFFYCCDSETGFRWLAQATFTSFLSLHSEVVANPGEWQKHTDDLDALITTSINERVTLTPLATFTPDDLVPTELALMQSLACMVATTDVCYDMSRLHPGCHVIVTRYKSSTGSKLRTYFMPRQSLDHRGPLTDAEFTEVVTAIIAREKAIHPDWK